MGSMRRRLRFCSAAWLLFQTVSLTALVPRECCRAHQPAAVESADCHRQTSASLDCAMHDHGMHDHGITRGMMHDAPAADSANQPADGECSMRGTCQGPAATFLALLANNGVLTEPLAISPALATRTLAPIVRENAAGNPAEPDFPPPRT